MGVESLIPPEKSIFKTFFLVSRFPGFRIFKAKNAGHKNGSSTDRGGDFGGFSIGGSAHSQGGDDSGRTPGAQTISLSFDPLDREKIHKNIIQVFDGLGNGKGLGSGGSLGNRKGMTPGAAFLRMRVEAKTGNAGGEPSGLQGPQEFCHSLGHPGVPPLADQGQEAILDRRAGKD